jgi:hypothetical protein
MNITIEDIVNMENDENIEMKSILDQFIPKSIIKGKKSIKTFIIY